MRSSGSSDLRAFIAVAELGSFSRAAERLGMAPSSLSQTIRNFEERLGIRLLQRTTRSVALTEAGRHLLLRVRPALAELDAALADVGQLRDRPAGIVRVRCLRHAYHRHVGPILAGFHAAFPDIRLDITIDDAVVDLVAGGYDVGFTLGEVLEKDMVAVRIGGELRQIAVASPAYIERHGRPETPRDLHAHRCVSWRWPGNTAPYRRGARISGTDAPTPTPVRVHAMRTDSGRPSSSIRFRTWTPMATSVAWRRSARDRSASPITRL